MEMEMSKDEFLLCHNLPIHFISISQNTYIHCKPHYNKILEEKVHMLSQIIKTLLDTTGIRQKTKILELT